MQSRLSEPRALNPAADAVRFEVPADSFSPMAIQNPAMMAALAGASAASGIPNTSGMTADRTAATIGDRAAAPAASIDTATKGTAVNAAAPSDAADCVDKPRVKAAVKPKPKASAASAFAGRVGEGTKSFSEQINQARKGFKPPVKVQPAMARTC